MGIFFFSPVMTGVDDPAARSLFQDCLTALDEHTAVTPIHSWPALASCKVARGDAVAFFNRPDLSYPTSITDFLQEASELGADICPIAISKTHRRPPTEVSSAQSFDVIDEIHQRGLTSSQATTVALSLARQLICKIQPTLSKDRMNMFICHRRVDGEELAASLHNQLRIRAQEGFRDLIDIRVGEDAQAVIEENLRASDVLVFLDTPRAAESQWIARELELALSQNIPIVWVRLGSEDGRPELTVQPSGRPHLSLSDLGLGETTIAPAVVDQIINLAFALTRQAAETVLSHILRVKKIVLQKRLRISEIDRKTLLYQVDVPRRGFRYRQRAMTHIVQFFGRRPTSEDVDGLWSILNASRDQRSQAFDAAVLVGPIPGQLYPEGSDTLEFIDSCDEYVASLSRVAASQIPGDEDQIGRGGLIISGAFPDCEPLYQHHVTNAVHAFAETMFARGVTVIFGGHPTFQHIIFDMGKRRRPQDFRQAIRVYFSQYFVTAPYVSEMENHASVIAIPAVSGDRALSLTAMRKAMIVDPLARGLVVIGGKTKATTGRAPGVDEEISLARSVGLPVFVIGSVGGRSAEIATELSAGGWKDAPNKLSPSDNDYLMSALDYHELANRILDEVGL